MKSAFITGTDSQGTELNDYLKSIGIDCVESNYLGYYTIKVDPNDYRKALLEGVKYSIEHDLKDVAWVNTYGERQKYSNGVWPLAYCFQKTRKIKSKTDKSVEYVEQTPYLDWIGDTDRKSTLFAVSSTPSYIEKMFDDLIKLTSCSFKSAYHYSDKALELKAICDIDDYKDISAKVIKYLKDSDIFELVVPEDFDGEYDQKIIDNFYNKKNKKADNKSNGSDKRNYNYYQESCKQDGHKYNKNDIKIEF